MKQFRRFLIPHLTLFFCSIFILNALAQEKLPEIVKKIEPSTVVILTYGKEGKFVGQGSGFFISQSGDIITNKHVLPGVHRAEVKTAKGKVYPITFIVAEDKEADIIRASVNIPLESVRPLSVSISIPEVGERVAVIGSPLGLERTVSDGIVSAVREIPTFGNIYQITAPISPGSSGSPVVNMKGEVIGIATFQFVEGQNLNSAIPGERIAKLKTEKGKTLDQWKMGNTEERLASAEGFFGAKWGMSVSQVRETFNSIFTSPGVEVRTTQTGNETLLQLGEARNILGCKVGISYLFEFRNDELYKVNYHEHYPLAPWYPSFTGKEKATEWCGAQLLSRYEDEEDSLYKKYGAPAKSEKYKKIWVLPSTSIVTSFIRPFSDVYFFSLKYEKRQGYISS